MTALLIPPRSRSMLDFSSGAIQSSPGVGDVDVRSIERRISAVRRLVNGPLSRMTNVSDTKNKKLSLDNQLRAKLVSLKGMTASVAMYFHPEWRTKLFARLDAILDSGAWNEEGELPSEKSFSTFLRMMIYLHPTRRPGIGLTPGGYFAAAWTRDSDRIIIECLPDDDVRWVINRLRDGEQESGAGRVSLHRIPDVTAGYEPEPLFEDGQQILA